MALEQMDCENPKLYSPLVLAYMGDAVLEIMVREKLIRRANMPVHKLHRMTVERVCADAQSAAVEIVYDRLTEEELAIYKRGRNANGNHVPKNADPQDYRRATGLEALFGYLHLKGKQERIDELFALIWKD
ncbi:Mini-ribonuclease 3 [uncultured Ruminococcus sp.]|nr:ribonuclease III domain-containing protein [Massiliimalia timonensis]SCH02203.1 Mini-ribonuclease 3 [uncultured Clostridium sp.]SCH98080.1 Mini-ribonuclease 3 [uncultured Ruminococcus sp.]